MTVSAVLLFLQLMNNPTRVSRSLCEGETVFHSLKTNEICLFLCTAVPGRPEPPLSLKTTDHIVYSSVSLIRTFMSLGLIEQISFFVFIYFYSEGHIETVLETFYHHFIWATFQMPYIIFFFL